MPNAQRAMWVNDYDLSGLGLTVEQVDGWLDSPSVLERETQLPQRAGTVPLAPLAETAPRDIVVTGVVGSRGLSMATCRAYIDALKQRLFAGTIEVTFSDHQDKFVLARCNGKQVTATPPQFANPYSRVTIRLHCPDPLVYAKLPTTVGFGAVASGRSTLPLGTGMAMPMIRVGPCTNPVLIYRDQRGIERQRMTFTRVIAAAEYLEIDTELGTVTYYTAGVVSNGLAYWTPAATGSASTEKVLTGFDPQDGDPQNSAWPTLECSVAAACEAAYRRAWL
jgi:hypothetical protein